MTYKPGDEIDTELGRLKAAPATSDCAGCAGDVWDRCAHIPCGCSRARIIWIHSEEAK